MKYYLAYGPNLNLVQMRQRCPNARVDVYAGVPYFYQKQTMQVQCVWDVTTRREVLHNIEAILYTLPASHPLGVPSRRYLQECKSGYDDFHFSFLPLRQALIDSSPEPHTK